MKAFKLHTTIETNIIFIDIIAYNKKWEEDTVSSKVGSLLKEKGITITTITATTVIIIIIIKKEYVYQYGHHYYYVLLYIVI
jgi:hypothetical protein